MLGFGWVVGKVVEGLLERLVGWRGKRRRDGGYLNARGESARGTSGSFPGVVCKTQVVTSPANYFLQVTQPLEKINW